MNSEEGLSGKTPKDTGRSPEDICVLLLDSDPTCLTIISKMLQKSGYRVVTAERAADALHILRDQDGKIDLIMAEAHLSDMDKYELLETITGISKLPIVVMAADGQAYSALGCMYKGAKHYLLKPFVMGDLKHLWQTTISSKRHTLSHLDTGRPKQNRSGKDAQPPLHAEKHSRDDKGKELAEIEEHKEDNDDNFEKKPKLICADELLNGSVQGVRGLGTEDAVNQGKKRKERAGTEKTKEVFSDNLRRSYEEETQTLLDANELNLDKNKKKERVEMETYEEDGDSCELGIQKQPKLVRTEELENRSPQNIGDLGTGGAYLDENLQHVKVTGLTEANVLPHLQEQGMPMMTMYQTVSSVHGGFAQSLERTMPSFGPADPLSPVESSSNDRMWTQRRQPMPRRGMNMVENPQQNVEDNPTVEELVNGEINVSDISELFFGNILELAELLKDDVVQEHEQQEQAFLQEEQGSSSDVHEQSPQDLLDETFNDLW